MSEDGKFSIEYKTFGTQSHNIMYITARCKMSLALSVAEIMCKSQAELRAIYDEWVRVSTADPATLKPIPIEMGKRNSKVIESTAVQYITHPSFYRLTITTDLLPICQLM